jgi:glucose-6-phosphate 1-dehydrogenase
MIGNLLLFGATGDLAGRFLLPALAALHADGRLPDPFRVVGAARQDWDDERFRRHAETRLLEHGPDLPAASRRALIGSLRYRRVDLHDASSVAAAVDTAGRSPASGANAAVAAYLALPPALFGRTVAALGEADMPAGSRIVVEKPFGDDQQSAQALNALLAQAAGDAGEHGVFRVDHVLGMTTVHNLAALRMFNPVLDAVWDGAHIEQVEILWEETLALEGRAGYYDRAGALKDVMQNHMIHLLCLVAMEPPSTINEHDLHDAKVEVLKSVRPPSRELIATRTQRGRYTAGGLTNDDDPDGEGHAVPSYVDEAGVDPERRTETLAEVALELRAPRWTGTRFVLRAGKALGQRRKGIMVHFRADARPGLDDAPSEDPARRLWIGIDGPNDLALQLTGGTAGLPPQPVPLTFVAAPPASNLPPYSRVLLDILEGTSGLSVRGDEAEEAWRVMSPVVEAWADDVVPMQDYRAGSAGLPPLRSSAQPSQSRPGA